MCVATFPPASPLSLSLQLTSPANRLSPLYLAPCLGACYRNTLEDAKVDGSRGEYVVKAYVKDKEEIRAQLRRTGTALPHIVDVNWRLDFCLKVCRRPFRRPVRRPFRRLQLASQNRPLARVAHTFPPSVTLPSSYRRWQNNHKDKANEPQYVISLKTEKPGGGTGDVQMSCTLAQLQDLVGKLKNACKSVESLAA